MMLRLATLTTTVLFLAATAPAQTAAELLQKGMYTQQTAGKIDDAIEVYRQAVATAGADRTTAGRAQVMIVGAMIQKGDFGGAAREFRTLAQGYSDQKDLMSAMGSMFRAIAGARMNGSLAPSAPVPSTLGTLQDGVYRHTATGVEIRIPKGWWFSGDGPSSGSGQAAFFGSGSQSYFVWMRSGEKDDDISLALDRDVAYKLHQRQVEGVENFRIRQGTTPLKWSAGNARGVSVAFEYGRDYADAEIGMWLRSSTTLVYFRASCKAAEISTAQDELTLLAGQTTLP